MPNILWFNQISKENIAQAGGKGANLGEMTKAGFPIPPGFVVTSEAYFSFVKHNRIDSFIREQTADLDTSDTDQLNIVSDAVKNRIMAGEIPQGIRNDIIGAYRSMEKGKEPFVAVRSSATAEDLPDASFAGQQSTYLNIRGQNNVVQAVKECWASLFEARAIFYRVENKFDHMKVGLAAVVQEMVQSEKAGVMFTVEPVEEDYDTIAIEAAYGLGELVVSGSITPDRYLVSKRNFGITGKEVFRQAWMITKVNDENVHANVEEGMAERQKISDSEIVELAKIGAKIEKHYGKPQDLEWAVANGKIYIVQSRPVTALRGKGGKSEAGEASGALFERAKEASDKEGKAGEAGGGMIEVANANRILKGLGASPGVGRGPVRIIPSPKDIDKMQKGEVLVTDMTTPDFVPAMKKAAAIVTNTGGRTCHAAIVSREMGIPCIVGAKGATDVLKEGMVVTVDAVHGMVYEGEVALGDGEKKAESGAAAMFAASTLVPVTGTKIYVNLAEVELADRTAQLPCDGVGLLRAEFMMAAIGEHPRKIINEGRQGEFIGRLADQLRAFASAFYPRPVVYRATDFKTNEYRNLKGGEEYEPAEANPMMGYRGCARYIAEPEVFKLELEAIKKVRDEFGMKNLWLMIPFVRRIGEIRGVKDILKEVGIHRTRDFKLWIMVEVPSTVFLIDDFCKEGIDGVSIGTNDLTQLVLGIDRDNATLAEGFDERNAAVLKAVEQVVKTCAKHNVTCSLCGQAPSVYPDFAEKLVEFGITSMSVNPDAVERTRRIVASAEQKVILKKLTSLSEHEHAHHVGSED